MDKIIPDLDLIGATAILMVVGYHVVQWLPAKPQWLLMVTNPGQYGVNLFFALSGFLVGSLYFRERMKYGNVDKSRFILKLITRTVPIYLIALAISFLGSRIFEGEAFEWTYLIFLQNYLEKIPYFKVSWSLCVEEHFYAILPFFLTIIYFLTKHSGKLVVKAIIISTLLLPTLLRISEFKQGMPFGYTTTASQFYMDSLGFGVLASWFSLHRKSWLAFTDLHVTVFIFLTAGLLFATNIVPAALVFGVGILLMGILFATVTLFSAFTQQLNLARHPFTELIALSSYSTYITHAVVLQALNMAFRKTPKFIQDLWPLIAIIFIGSALLAGIVFYKLIESPLLKIREKYYPSRGLLASG